VTSGLRQAAVEYLAMRRTLGFKLTHQARILISFVDYCEHHGLEHISTDAAVDWASHTPHSTDMLWWARRLMVVRIFARHLAAFDPATQIPPADVLPGQYRRVTPYLYSDPQIEALMRAAGALTPSLRAATYTAVIGLLAVSGMRIGEACRLDRPDVDLDSGLITIRDSKFGKSREIPLHPTTVTALSGYSADRDLVWPSSTTAAFFLSTRGTRINQNTIDHTFQVLLQKAGIAAQSGARAPRPHDLRHTFTMRTLLTWYSTGVDVPPRLPLLSTYLGHVDPKSTYWYLQATPELLALAVDRLDDPATANS
jgi:integrase/recombinase XerD